MKRLLLMLLTLTLVLGVFISCDKSEIYDMSEMSSIETDSGKSTITSSVEDTTIEMSEEIMSNEDDENFFETADLSFGSSSPPRHEIEFFEYTIEKIDGKYYLIFNDFQYSEYNKHEFRQPIKYTSLANLKNDLENGTLDSESLNYLLKWHVRTDNYDKLPICDLDRLWVPVLPDDWEYPTEVVWLVDSYRYDITHPNGRQLYITPITEEEYNAKLTEFEKSIGTNLDLESIFELFKEEIMPIRKLQNGEKTAYLLYENFASPSKRWIILFTNGDYWGCVYGDSYTLGDLTDEQVLSFGLEEYSE